jgi:hypothetical protein
MEELQPTLLNDASSKPLIQSLARERPLRIVIPGGSGQVGQMLARHFQQRGHQVTVLTRGPYTPPWQTVHWDGEHVGSWTETLEGADVCINLTGRSINCRYEEDNRKAIYTSRIQSTRLLNQVISRLSDPPRVWLNASAATLYKRQLDSSGIDLPLTESDEAGGDEPVPERWAAGRGFSKRVVKDWEAAFFETGTPRTRKIALRSAVTFSPTPGNVFAVLSNLVRFGLGGTQGNGRQFMTWIHEADYARAVEFLIGHEEFAGPFNIASPGPIPNGEFMSALRDAWNVPNGLPAPALFIHIGAFLMRTEPELVLQSCRTIPRRLLDAGFQFEFPEWAQASADLVRQWRHRNE